MLKTVRSPDVPCPGTTVALGIQGDTKIAGTRTPRRSKANGVQELPVS